MNRNRIRRNEREKLPLKRKNRVTENSDWVAVDRPSSQPKNHEQVLPQYICQWEMEKYLNDYFDENYKEIGNPTTMNIANPHFVFVGTSRSFVLKFRYYNLEGNRRKFSPKVEKFFWTESKKDLGSVLRISVLISQNYKSSSSFPVLVSYESRDCVMWRNNFFNKPHLRFNFEKYKPRYTTAMFLLDECVVFNTEGEKIQFWDFKTKTSKVWKNFLDPTKPDEFLGCQLEIFNFSEDLAFIGLVHDNKIQVHSYQKGNENNPHGITEIILQKPADHPYSEHRNIKLAIGKLHNRPFIGILEGSNFYFYEYFPLDPKKNSEFSERRTTLHKRIVFCELYDRVIFQNYEFLIWNSDHLVVYHPFQDYFDISDFPRDYPGYMEKITDNSLLFFGNKNGEFLSFELFERKYRYVKKKTLQKIELDVLDEELKFFERDGVCIISEDDSLKDYQVSGTKFGNNFFLGERLRQPSLLATNEAHDVVYVCSLSPNVVVQTNQDYTHIKYAPFPSIKAFNLRDRTWRDVLSLENSQTLSVNPIESNFPSYFSGMYYQKKDHCLLLVSTRHVYVIDIMNRNIKGVLSTKKLVFKKKLEFPNVFFECSCMASSSKFSSQIFILGEERSLVKMPPPEPMIIADSLCLYTIDLDKRSITLLENMNRNDVISRCPNKKLFAFHTNKNTKIKIYVVCDQYPYIFEKKGRNWQVVKIPFVELPPQKSSMNKEEREEEEDEGESLDEMFGGEGEDGYFQQKKDKDNSSKLKKRGLRISKFFISTVCKTPASILFLVDANTPRYRKFFNPYIFEFSVHHQRWKRPLSIDSVSLTQVLSASRGAIYLFKGGKRKKIMLYNESVYHSKKSFERNFISVEFM